MFLVIFVLAVIVSMPIVAIVLVSVASHREDAAGTLGGPARGSVQLAARRVLDFQSDVCWQPAAEARAKARQPVRIPAPPVREDLEDLEDSRVLVATSALALSSAA